MPPARTELKVDPRQPTGWRKNWPYSRSPSTMGRIGLGGGQARRPTRPRLARRGPAQRLVAAADLHRADLHGALLNGAELDGADLHRADLHDADLRSADLQWADLHDADLHGANLRNALLDDADLHRADRMRPTSPARSFVAPISVAPTCGMCAV